VRVQNINDFEPVTLANLKIQFIMRRCDLQHSGAKPGIDCLVCDDRDLCTREWSPAMLADKLLVARIGRVYATSRVTHERLGTRCGDLQKCPGILNDFITHEIQNARSRYG